MSSIGITSYGESNALEISVPESTVLTSSILAEERTLENKSREKEEIEKQKMIEKGYNLNNRQECLEKLKVLLHKSNTYTVYLLNRMKKQREEDQLRDDFLPNQDSSDVIQTEEKNEQNKESLLGNQTLNNNEVKSPVSESRINGHLDKSSVQNCENKHNENHLKSPYRRKTLDPSTKSKKSSKKIILGESNSSLVENKSLHPTQNSCKISVDTCRRSPRLSLRTSLSPAVSPSSCRASPTTKTRKIKQKANSPKCDTSVEANEKVSPKNNIVFPKEQPEYFVGGVLRDYQIEGYQWLRTIYENGINGILADEMGLGKTVQCIAHFADLTKKNVPGPFLVVAPLSTLPNWLSEFRRFTPKVPILLYHGSKDERSKLRAKFLVPCDVFDGSRVRPVIITSYEIVMADRQSLHHIKWSYLIVDEGHRIKNSQCRLIRELKMYDSTHRLLLTGTPLQNNLSELWSLLNFLLPEIFDDQGSFQTWFNLEFLSTASSSETIVEEEEKNNILSMFHQIIRPFMLRRLKSDVDLQIPPKRELLVYAPLVNKQEELYKMVVNKTLENLLENQKVKEEPKLNEKGRPSRVCAQSVDYTSLVDNDLDDFGKYKSKYSKEDEFDDLEKWFSACPSKENTNLSKCALSNSKERKNIDSILNLNMRNTMMILRKICNHPYLVEYPLDPKTNDFLVNESIVKTCGKLSIVDKMLAKLKEEKHKVLIFSYMTSVLDVLGDYLYYRNYKYSRLDGTMKLEERSKEMELFNNDPDVFVFLLSTKAGGLGINLTAADTVIIYDSGWNPQNDLQAQDRCHRIGQTHPVMIYRLVTINTIDQKIVERACSKRKLEKIIIHKERFKTGLEKFNTDLAPISPHELLKLLEETDHDRVVKSEGDDVITDEELFSLLDRSDLEKKWTERRTGPSTDSHQNEEIPDSDCVEKSSSKNDLFKVIASV